MKCLILAAGFGSRLRAISDSKPLTPVAGRPLIEHVVTASAAGGARQFVIVTGHEAEPLEAFLGHLGGRLGLTLACVRAEDWSRPNGYSVLCGAAAIEGEYLLLMSDHLVDPSIVRRLVEAESRGGVILAVDTRLRSPTLDLEDATKVEQDEAGRILRIGKQLTSYNAIDTGCFRAGPALVQAIEGAIQAGGIGSLTEGVQRLATRGDAWTLNVGECDWLDVDDPAALAVAEKMIGG